MQATQSVVISCAGIGSRLGLGTTKALINIHGKSLIRWQLELFQDVEDIRVVVGFEAQDVIEEVRRLYSTTTILKQRRGQAITWGRGTATNTRWSTTATSSCIPTI